MTRSVRTPVESTTTQNRACGVPLAGPAVSSDRWPTKWNRVGFLDTPQTVCTTCLNCKQNYQRFVHSPAQGGVSNPQSEAHTSTTLGRGCYGKGRKGRVGILDSASPRDDRRNKPRFEEWPLASTISLGAGEKWYRVSPRGVNSALHRTVVVVVAELVVLSIGEETIRAGKMSLCQGLDQPSRVARKTTNSVRNS